ncbi:MAG TPA: imidazole glycerol phosphate synthase subunit HisH [Candidatus Acidoferrum sp.]|nr:imidazole glycerol phosphate synthase subunit HisH [Candidatus Acidoferrum sp.]
MKVTVIDYRAGNVTSVERALRRLGTEVSAANRPEEILSATCLILPGVGHCAALMGALDAQEIRNPLLERIADGIPFLGICLGLQALYESSDEAPGFAGLGLFKGRVSKLPQTVKLPHMGWNQLRASRPSALLRNISPEAYFYFAHSYAAPDSGPENTALATHGRDFMAIAEHQNMIGVQFHPEKSGAPGAQFLENFLRRAA